MSKVHIDGAVYVAEEKVYEYIQKLQAKNEKLRTELGKEKVEREIEKTVDDEAILGYREENKRLREDCAAAQSRFEAMAELADKRGIAIETIKDILQALKEK